ncbi:SPOR domain-containing protein [Lysobacter capsici]|uniref:SPOR domain-containing protein n=1 Tax=Lysobacter capsici TaxID=435897 RepID=UPI00177AAED8|nr:SPOR domain-containing protein [Lysobacter capsici]UOF14089.1 SPOR domain-containing protein [Lysobacter capsici]
MLVRALIVLLIALNLGVAAWWIARPAPPAPPREQLPLGVARLRMVDEPRSTAKPQAVAPAKATAAAAPAASSPAPLPASAAPASSTPTTAAEKPPTPPAASPPATSAVATATPLPTTPAPTPAPIAPPPEAKPQCFSIGPFADTAAAAEARAKLQPLAQKLATRTQAGTSNARGWRVYMPQASAEAAQATAQRIRAAGFSDLFVMSGSEANAIALGRFRSEESARKRGAELSAAGFTARVEALGESGEGPTWIDVATTTSNGDALRRAAGASRWRGRSCAGLG